MTLTRKSPMKRHSKKDPVSMGLIVALWERDGKCIAPGLDPECGPCSLRGTVENVKSELRAGVRAPSDLAHCVMLCSNHTEPGAKAGVSWNATKEHRALVRSYLASL